MTFGQFMYYDFAYILHPTGSASRCRATIPHINSETNPPPPIINVVCKCLRHFLGTSFGVAALPIYCNSE